jgi:histidinol-phosphate aminotransferase
MQRSKLPEPRSAIADPELIRPDWTLADSRDRRLLWLDKNENSDPTLAGIVADVLASIPRDTLQSYPDSAPLYRKLARHIGTEPDNLLLSAGSDGAIRAVFEAFIEPGDIVIHTQPTFAMYAVYSRIYGAEARPLAYRPSNAGPALECDDVVHAINTLSPKLVCLPNPDSPTGTVFAPNQIRRIIEAAGSAGALMLVDEAYYPFHDETVLPWIADYPHLVVTRSTGKAWGLAGFRIGYAVASPELAKLLHKVRAMYETNTLAIAVFERMLDHENEMWASVERLNKGKAYFLGQMEALGFRVLRGAGNFLHVAFGAKANEIHDELANVVYYRKDFNAACLKGFSRFSATTRELFEPVVDRIRKVV